jgi:hypothetical protein
MNSFTPLAFQWEEFTFQGGRNDYPSCRPSATNF